MGFLSGVLDAVKDDDAVKKYNEYMPENNKLEKVLETLSKNIGSGRAGLVDAVAAVKGWLEGYEGEVGEKTKKVTDNITHLMNDLTRHKDNIDNEKLSDLSTQIQNWTARAEQYRLHVVAAEKDMKHLDSQLSGKLKCNISLLVQATGTFKEDAKVRDLKIIFRFTESKLSEALSQFENVAVEKCKWIQYYLKTQLLNLCEKLTALRDKKFLALAQSIGDLTMYSNVVDQGIKDIIDKYGRDIVGGLQQIIHSASEVKTLVEREKQTLKEEVEKLRQQIILLIKLEGQVKIAVPKDHLKSYQKQGEDIWNLTKQIQQLKDQIVSEMKQHVGTAILPTIKKEVSTIKASIGEPKTLPGDAEPENNSIYHNWDAIREDIEGCVGGLIGEEGGAATGTLKVIVAGVKKYAEGFSREAFEADVVKEWIHNILEDTDESIVRSKIRQYVTLNQGQGKLQQKNAESIKSAIERHLPGHIHTEITMVAQTHLRDANVDNIAAKFDGFAKQISNTLNDTLNSSIGAAVLAIEKELGLNDGKANFRRNLESAVRTIVQCLVHTFQHVAKELKRFADVSQIKKLTQVIPSVEDLGKQLTTNHPGDKIDKALSDVKPRIQTLDESLDQAQKVATNTGYTATNNTHIADKVRAMDEKFDAANKQLTALLKDTAIKGIHTLWVKIDDMIRDHLNGIRDKFAGLRNVGETTDTPAAAVQGSSTLMKQTTQLENDLKDFLQNKVGDNNSKDGSVHKDLKVLKDNIKLLVEEVNKVRTNVETVQAELQHCMRFANRLYIAAPQRTTSVFDELRRLVNADITAAFHNMQNQIKDVYAERKKNEVAALYKIVDDQFTEIKQIIENDKDLSLKGYLSKLRSKFIPPFSDFTQPASRPQLPEKKLSDLAPIVKNSFTNFFDDLRTQPDLLPLTGRVNAISNALSTLLTSLTRYDHTFTKNLAKVKSEIDDFAQQTYANTAQRVSRSLVPGSRAFVKELDKAYVRVYDGHSDHIDFDNLVQRTGQIVDLNGPPRWITVSTPDGTKLAKILLTIFNFIYEDIIRLINKCDDNWGSKKLCLTQGDTDNPLGLFLQRCGYLVAQNENSKDGETQCRRSITGADILAKVTANIDDRQITSHLTACESNLTEEGKPKKQASFKFADLLDCLLNHIDRYNEVCHYSTHFAKRQPCSTYEMLIWLSGLPYSVAQHSLLHDGIGNLLDNPNKALADVDGISLLDHESSYLDANPRKITWYGINEALEILCSSSYDLLVSIAGTGDADTIYGSDLCNNSFKFKYPASGEDCLDMLLDILRRLFPPLRFLQTQCSVGASHNGWLQCTYGRDVQPATWPCKEHPTDRSKCQPNCQPKSPLMSYLSDCHVGCLPHQLTSIGCRYECKTCPSNKPGMPCLTPLGFRGFSGSMKTGRDLCNVLAKFFGNPYLASFLCLAPKAPSTLPEHFSFTLSLVTGWTSRSKYDTQTLKDSIDKSINGVSIDLYKNASELTDAVSNAYSHCTAEEPKCEDSHLMDLTSSSTCNKNQYSAPYLESLCADSYLYLANKHSNAYLSWVLYLPWNFHKYLESLLGAFKDIFCNDWGCRSCLNGKCKKGEHGVLDNTCQCASMVKCSGVMPTLYRYGFAFQDAPTLDARKSAMKCFDFQTLLFKVTRSNYFSKLFDECDMLLWRIREPFSYLVMALWLLSLLYLLHIMVIRLDLLHIKSHLHSPSSHRIAAQSLLAAGRVNKLNRVFYLQP
ncbi:hypothetical protein, conserved [Babesia bigemina]|uniref:C3H1-type domain-containing protein n=1 Tax=Babesia bigemina TaxID=5866 RepID=A0A061BS68_BABBI|nr:hypothetical protein, conserved [Babesia bigemina]CDR71401.1 hypothetical protein, conserved [Babesia bigemina]|eukprot:XP_012770351.1 hypothetical protein, conserved [Babesia bigemina]